MSNEIVKIATKISFSSCCRINAALRTTCTVYYAKPIAQVWYFLWWFGSIQFSAHPYQKFPCSVDNIKYFSTR